MPTYHYAENQGKLMMQSKEKVKNKDIVLFKNDFLRQTLQQILQQYCLLFDMLYAAD